MIFGPVYLWTTCDTRYKPVNYTFLAIKTAMYKNVFTWSVLLIRIVSFWSVWLGCYLLVVCIHLVIFTLIVYPIFLVASINAIKAFIRSRLYLAIRSVLSAYASSWTLLLTWTNVSTIYLAHPSSEPLKSGYEWLSP